MKLPLLLINQDKRQLAFWIGNLREWKIPFQKMEEPLTALQVLELKKVTGVVARNDLPYFPGGEIARRVRGIDAGTNVVLLDKKGGSALSNFQVAVGRLLLVSGDVLVEEEYSSFLRARDDFPGIIGRSPAIQALFSIVEKVKDREVTVLIQGESGSGKELIARAIHRNSRRADRAFISVNCAALPETLLESELFGHEKGAFTGANNRVIGRFEQADRGSLFLDEIGDMSPATQAKVLRVLEGHEFERVGGRETIKVDVRVVAATNRDLRQRIVEGSFREDLYYRIGAFPVSLPPLRERKEDLPLLIAHIIRNYNRTTIQRINRVTDQALDKLFDYPWPGNIRQLENVVKRAAILSNEGVVDSAQVILEEGNSPPAPSPPPVEGGDSEFKSLAEVEKAAIEEALALTGMNISRAARGLGISRVTLYKKARRYGIAITR